MECLWAEGGNAFHGEYPDREGGRDGLRGNGCGGGGENFHGRGKGKEGFSGNRGLFLRGLVFWHGFGLVFCEGCGCIL